MIPSNTRSSHRRVCTTPNRNESPFAQIPLTVSSISCFIRLLELTPAPRVSHHHHRRVHTISPSSLSLIRHALNNAPGLRHSTQRYAPVNLMLSPHVISSTSSSPPPRHLSRPLVISSTSVSFSTLLLELLTRPCSDVLRPTRSGARQHVSNSSRRPSAPEC